MGSTPAGVMRYIYWSWYSRETNERMTKSRTIIFTTALNRQDDNIPNLNFRSKVPNKKWVTDFTEAKYCDSREDDLTTFRI